MFGDLLGWVVGFKCLGLIVLVGAAIVACVVAGLRL